MGETKRKNNIGAHIHFWGKEYADSFSTKTGEFAGQDFDRIIARDRTIMWEMQSLEIENKFDDISVGQILEEIKQEAQRLREPKGAPPIEQTVVKPRRADVALISKLHRIDNSLKRIPLYRMLRPAIAQRLKTRLMSRRVNASDLMKYDGAKFVSACYQTFLGRLPEPEAMHNARSALADGRVRKICFLMQVANSEEAGQYPIVLRGMWKYLCKERLRSMALYLPFAGWLARMAATVGALGYQQELLEAKYQENYRGLQAATQREDELVSGLQAAAQREDELASGLQAAAQREDELASGLQAAVQRVKMNEQMLSKQEASLGLLGDSVNSLNTWRAEVQAGDEQRRKRIEWFKRRLDSFYIHYEHDMRAITEDIFYSRYGQYFGRVDAWAGSRDRATLRVVDLGCGCGMWLKALEKRGYKPMGVDSNEQMLIDAKDNVKQAQLYHQDAVSFLQEQGEGTLDMISSFHMIEHMEPMEIFEFFEACVRVLRPGGLFILETPNAKNILVATEMFYTDVTHKHIIPWELLEFLMKDFGFEQIETVPVTPLDYFPMEYKQNDPVSHMAFRFNNETTYSVWAVKPA